MCLYFNRFIQFFLHYILKTHRDRLSCKILNIYFHFVKIILKNDLCISETNNFLFNFYDECYNLVVNVIAVMIANKNSDAKHMILM